MNFNEVKALVAEMTTLENEAKTLMKKAPFMREDGEKLKHLMARIKANYVALGREDAREAMRGLDKAMNPLILLLAGMNGIMVNGVLMPITVFAMLRNIDNAFTNLINMYPMICLSQVKSMGMGSAMTPRPQYIAMPMPAPVMSY